MRVFSKELDLLYDERPTEEATISIIEKQKDKFIQTIKPQFGDVIVFNVKGMPTHVGVYITKDLFLHTRKETGCVLERFAKWNKRVVGYYRWPK